MIPEDKVREVADRVSIVEVVSDYVELRRAGSNFTGLCPFHKENTPSFNVNPAREIFHCFGCGAGGSAFSFIMRIEGVNFPEAVKLLARKVGIQIEERELSREEKKSLDENSRFLEINRLTADYYRSVLVRGQDGEEARIYLENRSVAADIAEAYRLGFAPDRRDGLVKHLRNSGVDLETARKLGVVKKSDSGWYDLFRNRLIFPIRNPRGEFIAFAGRVLDASLPKYINSPESPLYHKSSVLFGLDMALPSIRSGNSVIIVEGYFDHLALHKAGIYSVVATCGTALTVSHANLIKRHAERVYTLFDCDNAGKKATIRSMDLFLEQKIPAFVISLPDGEDPDSFLARHSSAAFFEAQKKALPVFDFYLRTLLQETPPVSVSSKIKVINQLAPSLSKVGSIAERALYKKEICRLLDISFHELTKQIDIASRVKHLPVQEEVAAEVAELKTDRSQETLLALATLFPEAVAALRTDSIETLFSGEYLSLARTVIADASEDNSVDWNRVLDQLENQREREILSKILFSSPQLDGIDWSVAYEECRQKRLKGKLSLKEISLRLAVIDSDSAEHAELLKQAESIRSNKLTTRT